MEIERKSSSRLWLWLWLWLLWNTETKTFPVCPSKCSSSFCLCVFGKMFSFGMRTTIELNYVNVCPICRVYPFKLFLTYIAVLLWLRPIYIDGEDRQWLVAHKQRRFRFVERSNCTNRGHFLKAFRKGGIHIYDQSQLCVWERLCALRSNGWLHYRVYSRSHG